MTTADAPKCPQCGHYYFGFHQCVGFPQQGLQNNWYGGMSQESSTAFYWEARIKALEDRIAALERAALPQTEE